LGFLGPWPFRRENPIHGCWNFLDFLGFSRPNPDLSMGYAGKASKGFSRRFLPRERRRNGSRWSRACGRAGLFIGQSYLSFRFSAIDCLPKRCLSAASVEMTAPGSGDCSGPRAVGRQREQRSSHKGGERPYKGRFGKDRSARHSRRSVTENALTVDLRAKAREFGEKQ
jgi:hypothetical protein